MTRIFIWPDASWMYAEDYDDVRDRWRGDDFIDMNTELTNEEDINALAEELTSWPYEDEE